MVRDFKIIFKDSVVMWVKASRCEVLQSSIVFYAPVAYPVLNELDVCQFKFDFSDDVRVVEICSDSIEPYEKDVTEELRLQCKSSRGGVTGDIVRPPFGNIVFDFEDYILRFLEIGIDIAISVTIVLLLGHFLEKLFGG